MEEIMTFEQITDDPYGMGLCAYCRMIPMSSSPNGPIMCEGRGCEDAYERYVESMEG